LPISQIDIYRTENVEQFVNQRLLCMIAEVDPSERNLVVSRKALLELRCRFLDRFGDLAEGAAAIANGFAAAHMCSRDAGARMLFDGRPAGIAGAAFAGATTIDAFDAHERPGAQGGPFATRGRAFHIASI
jgi:hypothetical protein